MFLALDISPVTHPAPGNRGRNRLAVRRQTDTPGTIILATRAAFLFPTAPKWSPRDVQQLQAYKRSRIKLRVSAVRTRQPPPISG